MLAPDRDESSTSVPLPSFDPEHHGYHHENHDAGYHATSSRNSSARGRGSTRTERLPPRRSQLILFAAIDALKVAVRFVRSHHLEAMLALFVRHLPSPLRSTCTPSRRGSRYSRTSRCTRSIRDRSLRSRLHLQWSRQGVSRPQIGQLPSKLSSRLITERFPSR